MKNGCSNSMKKPVAYSARPFARRKLRRGFFIGTLSVVLLSFSGAALSGSVSYTYDSLGRLKTATYSNGVVVTYVYDAAGNRTSKVTSGA